MHFANGLLCFRFWGTRQMEFEFSQCRVAVQHGLKETGPRATLRMYVRSFQYGILFVTTIESDEIIVSSVVRIESKNA